MNEQAGSNRDGQKRRSFTEVVALFAPIVPLPGDPPRASVAAVPDAPDAPDDLPPATGPQPIPLPPRLRAAVLPGDAPSAPVRTEPEGPDDDLLPAHDPQPIAIPPHPPTPPSLPSQAVPEPEAEPIAEVPADPEPMDDAAFRRSIAPPSLADVPGQAAAAAAGRMRPRRRRAWPWVGLIVLSVAGAAAVWVQRAPEQLVTEPQSVGPTAELAAPAPAGTALSPEAAPTPPSPTDVATEPNLPSAPQATSEPPPAPIPEPTPAPAPPADVAAEPVLPPAPQAASEPAPQPTPEPILDAAPAPDWPGASDLAAPEPDAEPSVIGPELPLPIPPIPVPPIPVPPLPIPPVPTLAPPDRRVVIYRRPASSVAAAEAARLAEKLRPLAAQIETRTAAAISRLPTLRYFHAEDADAAQELATALRRPDAEWRVQGMLTQAPSLPPHSFQIWLPDR